jgi:phosphate transport system substrate-binding protein
MNSLKYIVLTWVSGLWLLACGPEERPDTPTSGQILAVADESLKPLVESQRMVFEAQNPKAKIKTAFLPEQQAIQALIKSQARMAVVTRELTADERSIFEEEKVPYSAVLAAMDGIALIVHPSNPDSSLTLPRLKAILSQQKKRWSDLGQRNKSSEEIVVVFDNGSSANLSYILRKLGLKKEQIKGYALKNNQEVIAYVRENPNALGVIGVNWLSDSDSRLSQQLVERIKVLWLAEKDNAKVFEYFQPFGEALYYKWYPLRSEVYVITKEGWTGLGAGFQSFWVSDPGQLVVLKEGLHPAMRPMYVRSVKITRDKPIL